MQTDIAKSQRRTAVSSRFISVPSASSLLTFRFGPRVGCQLCAFCELRFALVAAVELASRVPFFEFKLSRNREKLVISQLCLYACFADSSRLCAAAKRARRRKARPTREHEFNAGAPACRQRAGRAAGACTDVDVHCARQARHSAETRQHERGGKWSLNEDDRVEFE